MAILAPAAFFAPIAVSSREITKSNLGFQRMSVQRRVAEGMGFEPTIRLDSV